MSRAAQAFIAATVLGGIVFVAGPGPASAVLALVTGGVAGAVLVMERPCHWSLRAGYVLLLAFVAIWAYSYLATWRLNRGGTMAVERLALDRRDDVARRLAARLAENRELAARVAGDLDRQAQGKPGEIVQDPELFVALGKAVRDPLREGIGLEVYDRAGSLRAWWGDPRGERIPPDSVEVPVRRALVRRPAGYTLVYAGVPWTVVTDTFRVLVKDVWAVESPIAGITDPSLILPTLERREDLSFRVLPADSVHEGSPILGADGRPVAYVIGQRFMVDRFLEERRLETRRLLGLLYLWPLVWSVAAVWHLASGGWRRESGGNRASDARAPDGSRRTTPWLAATGRLALLAVVWFFLVRTRYLALFLPIDWFSPLGFAVEMFGPGGRSAGDLLTTVSLAMLGAIGVFALVPVRHRRSILGTAAGIAGAAGIAWLALGAATSGLQEAFRGMSLNVFFSPVLLFSPHYLMVMLSFALLAGVGITVLAAGLRPLGVPTGRIWLVAAGMTTAALLAAAAWILPREVMLGHVTETQALLAIAAAGSAWLVHAAGVRRATGQGAGLTVGLLAVGLGALLMLPMAARERVEEAQNLLVERAERLGQASAQWLQYTMSRTVDYLLRNPEVERAIAEGDRDAALLLWSQSPLRTRDFASGLYLMSADGEVVSQFALTAIDLTGRARTRAREGGAVQVDVEGSPEEGGIWWATVPVFSDTVRLGAAVAMSTDAAQLRDTPAPGAAFLLSDLLVGSAPAYEPSLYRTLAQGETPAPRSLLTSVERPDGTRVRLAMPLEPLLPDPRTYAVFAFVSAVFGLLLGLAERWTDPQARARWWNAVRTEHPLRSFRVQLLLAFVAVAAVPLTLYAVLGYRATRQEVEEATRLVATEALGAGSRMLVGHPALEQGTTRALTVRLRLIAEILEQDVILFWRGRSVASSRPEIFASRLFADRMPGEVYAELFSGGQASVFDATKLGERSFLVAYRALKAPEAPAGYVLATPLLIREDQARLDLQRLGEGVFLLSVFSIVFLLVVGRGLARFMARPLGALEMGTRQIAAGRLSYRLPKPARQDEFGRVQGGFNVMAERLDAGQRALEEEKSRVQAILSSVGAGVVALDGEGRVRLLNERAAVLLGESPSRVLGRLAGELSGDESPATAFWRLVDRQRGQGRADRDVILRRDGQDHHYHVVLTTLREADDREDRGLVVAFEDITANVESQRVLAWGEMARQVAHEIKNPLTPMKLSLQHLERTVGDKPDNFEELFHANLALVLAEIDRLERIAGNFARFAVPDPGAFVPFDAVEVARDALTLFDRGGELVRYSLERAGEERQLLGDPEGFRRILVNLLQNARDAVLATGTGNVIVRLDWEREPGWARVSVLDDGVGLPEEGVERLFEPSFSTKTRGTGLGLAITRRIVEAWGGTIGFERREEGGTAIHARLRAADG